MYPQLSPGDFERMSRFIHSNFGLKMPQAKKILLESRLRKRLRHLGLETFGQYCDYLFGPEGLATESIFMMDAVTTNKTLGPKALWDFMAGRGMHEKVLAELKTGYAFNTIPTLNYAANCTWQILSVLAHNLITSFQIATGARRRHANRKRSPIVELKSIQTLRYELFNRAGILQHPQGRATLTLSRNLSTRQIFDSLVEKLARAA